MTVIMTSRAYNLHLPKGRGSLRLFPMRYDVDEEYELCYCKDCLKLLTIHVERIKGRTYGEAVCLCGTAFVGKSPTQMFHST